MGNRIGNIKTGNSIALPCAWAIIAAIIVLADANPRIDADIESKAYHHDDISMGKNSKNNKNVMPLRKIPIIMLKNNLP